MDCRRIIWASLWMVGGTIGCTHQEINTPSTTPLLSQHGSVGGQSAYAQTQIIPPAGAVIHPEPELPKRAPTADTCAKYGDLFALMAQEPGIGQAKVQQLRDNALKAYQQALEIDPKNLAAYQSLAHLYLELNDLPHASMTYQKALQIVPNNAGLWHEMGLALMGHRDYAGALAGLSKATTLDPENREYSNSYGYALARAGQYDQALAAFARHNDQATAHYNLARMLAHMQQPALSLAQVRMALAQNPDFGPARKLEAELQAQGMAQIQAVSPPETHVAQPATGLTQVRYVAGGGTWNSQPAAVLTPYPQAVAVQPAKQVIVPPRPQLQPVIFTEPDMPREFASDLDGQRLPPPPPMYSMPPAMGDGGRR